MPIDTYGKSSYFTAFVRVTDAEGAGNGRCSRQISQELYLLYIETKYTVSVTTDKKRRNCTGSGQVAILNFSIELNMVVCPADTFSGRDVALKKLRERALDFRSGLY